MATTSNLEYGDNNNSTSWEGISLSDSEEFLEFLQNEVADRLYDISGRNDFREDLRGLSLTGMGRENLEAILNSEEPEERDWAIGEAIAEAFLISEHKVLFPWNMERDKRNPKASLQGADIVGFLKTSTGFRFVLGEVKTSSEKRYPPQNMSGRSGQMGHQIDNLANDLSVIYQLIRWLHPRCKNTEYQEAFEESSTIFFDSGNKDMILYGILIRDTTPNELDLRKRGNSLGNNISTTTCKLIAIYLPCEICDLPDLMKGGIAS